MRRARRVRAGDAGGVLKDVIVHVQVAEGGPGDAGPLPIHVHAVAVAFGEEVGHQPDHVIGAQPLAALFALVHLQLEARQRGHDEEVAVEVRHCLFDHCNLEGRVGLVGEQVRPHHRLVEVRGHFGDEQRVVAVEHRLVLPGQIRVHGVAELVGQRAQAEHLVSVAHHDEGVRARRTGRERAAHLALARHRHRPNAAPGSRGGQYRHIPRPSVRDRHR